ncbi:hypothetical protein Salat_1651200 [Sesamum alatum]|uniref:Calmodulin-binding protein n=1 Tax=Sesamum alatum TaxID=300844 RepID=A0AAE2CJL3_9LAMI|nr:hypothetical protein Salat_1651200 [Sesamum alatum]
MEEELENPATATTTTAAAAAEDYTDDIDSCCSTPYVSAPSSPGRGTPAAGFYYSAPASPTHFVLSTTSLTSYTSSSAAADASSSFEFDFSATFPSTGASSPESMTSADELFFNGQIRPMKLSTHLQRPQLLAPLIESDDVAEEEQTFSRGRDLKLRAGSLRRRTRSMSPLRTEWHDDDDDGAKRQNEDLARKNPEEDKVTDETTPCPSRSSSAGRSSRRWIFLKEFLYRSKSEGRNEGHKFWGSLSFSPVKDKRSAPPLSNSKAKDQNGGVNQEGKKRAVNSKNGAGKRRVPSPSPHELHYTANRAQAEEMRKKTFLPYRQGLLGCLGFSSRSYGAMNGFARALNPVSSR